MYLFRQIKFIFLALIGFGLLLACHKKPLKQPVSVNITMDMNRLSDPLHSHHFEVGNIWIQSIRLLGDRVEGEDIDYLREFPGGLAFDINGQINLSDLGFDLPQGDYDSLNLEIVTIANASTTLKIAGQFVSPTHTMDTLALVFEVDEPLVFAWKVQNGNSSQISLNANTDYQLQVHFDPIYWFKDISYQMLDAADSVFINNVNTISINKSQNTGIFSIVKKRIKEGNQAFF
jgi:hypothetical protein